MEFALAQYSSRCRDVCSAGGTKYIYSPLGFLEVAIVVVVDVVVFVADGEIGTALVLVRRMCIHVGWACGRREHDERPCSQIHIMHRNEISSNLGPQVLDLGVLTASSAWSDLS
jgi:hypothetical protein